jgi:serine/threonine-protein kinase
MSEHVTLLRPSAGAPDGTPASYALPPDLLEQVRGRVKLLTILLFAAFAFDVVHAAGAWLWLTLSHTPFPDDAFDRIGFFWIDTASACACATLWWLARDRRVPPSRLHAMGLIFEVVICFAIAFTSIWSYYLEHRIIPNLTWVPFIVVLFPLVLPGRPRKTLAAAIVSAGMAPLALAIHHGGGRVVATEEDFARTVFASTFAVVFAYFGARIVYRLGRDVAAAREMGSYRLVEMLGRGGMGEVWRARHRLLARPAAIKLIRRDLTDGRTAPVDATANQRFEREAQVIAGLRSPHTINLFDFGTAADGTFYYVMELLEGLDVQTLVNRFGPVPPARAIHIMRQMCHSLSEAHARGVIHRDIKPANVFLCRYGEEVDFVQVLDFGLVKETARAPDAETHLTGERAVPGTPAFLAPEQALGTAPLDGRADIYAMGCVAYWLLTGQLVFTAASPLELIVKHANERAVPPSARTELPITPALDRLVLACLEKDAAARPQTARALSDALAALEGADDWSEGNAGDWWEKHLPSTS